MFFAGKRPKNLGVSDGQLARCSKKPNNVSSQTAPGSHYIEPLQFEGEASAAMQKLKAVLESYPRTTIVEARDDYLYAECATALMGYVDDVEFYCDGSVIHARSASRLGYSDMGANRKRIEAIRAAFSQA